MNKLGDMFTDKPKNSGSSEPLCRFGGNESFSEALVVPDSMLLFRNVLFVVFSIVGTFGNVLVISAVFTSKRLNTASNKYIMNLAIADVLVCSVLMPYSVGTDARQGAPPGCTIMAGLSATFICVSMNNLALIAFNRYVLILKSREKYAAIFSDRNLKFSLAAVWVYALIICLPPCFGFGDYGYNEKMGVCLFEWNFIGYIYTQTVLHTLSAFPTMAWTLYSYVSIFKAFKKVDLSAIGRDVPRPLATVSSNNFSSVSPGSNFLSAAGPGTSTAWDQGVRHPPREVTNMQKHKRDKYRIVFNMFIIWCTFVSCWMPLILVYTVDFHMEVSANFYHLAGALAYLNSAINPIIYAGLNKNFRSAFTNMLLCKKYRQNTT